MSNGISGIVEYDYLVTIVKSLEVVGAIPDFQIHRAITKFVTCVLFCNIFIVALRSRS